MNETEIIPSAFDGLNTRQKNFVLNYMESRVATTAYLEAYSGKAKELDYNTAGVNSHNLLKNPKVKAAIEEKFTEIWEKRGDKVGQIFDEFKALGFSDIKNILDFKDGNLTVKDFQYIDTRAIKKIKIRRVKEESFSTETKSVETDIIELELHDKKGSLSEIAEILSLKKQQIEITGNVKTGYDLSRLTDEELEQFELLRLKMDAVK